MKGVLCAALLLATSGQAPVPVTYRFTEVKSKVVLTHAGQESRAQVGESAEEGDEIRTGMFARTTLDVPERASRFEVFSSTKVRLAGGEPGVLVVIERGRLKGIFDALVGNEERLVSTPGAVLAVRGTRYGIEVDREGIGMLAVFEGTVEVRPRAANLPMLRVPAGQLCSFGPSLVPMMGVMPQGMSEHRWNGGGAMHDMGSQGMSPGHGNHPARPGSMGGMH
jgi:hypothetical protein